MPVEFFWATPVVAFAVAALLIRALLSKVNAALLDVPNLRSLHEHPVPRVGGLGVVPGLLAGWLLGHNGLLLLAALTVALCLVSYLDDRGGLAIGWRISAHLAAALIIVCDLMPGEHWALQAALVLTIVWMINLYNFMDGADGLAGGMALIGFGSYGIAAAMGSDIGLAMLCLSISAAAIALLLFNFFPARVFLGDAGSIPLGFLAATLGLVGWQRALWPWWFPALVFSPFIFDASLTLAKRLLRGDAVWKAHREHYYQRLVMSGFGHRNTALAEYSLMAACGITAVAVIESTLIIQAMAILVWLATYALLAALIDRRWNRRQADETA